MKSEKWYAAMAARKTSNQFMKARELGIDVPSSSKKVNPVKLDISIQKILKFDNVHML